MKCTENELPYYLWLDQIPQMGRKINRKLIDKFKSPIAIYNMEETELRKYLKEEQFYSLRKEQKKTRQQIEDVYETVRKKQINCIPYTHDKFPEKLKRIPDPPYMIYVRGVLPQNDLPSVAMIGTRKCSEYGKYMAKKLASEFSQYDCQIISGMASGIDGISQRTVLEQGGKTYAVLGSGVDFCYPKENQDIFDKIPDTGGVISEYPPGTPPLAGQFPPRNRIISALSDVVLVIEAKEKSGTLITVDMALEQGKEVYVVPGRVTDSLSSGCIRLMKQGAGIAVSAEEILREVYGDRLKKREKDISVSCRKENSISEISPLGRQILEVMKIEAETLDEIYSNLLQKYPTKECSITDLMCEIMNLQLDARVERVGGKYHLLNKFTCNDIRYGV